MDTVMADQPLKARSLRLPDAAWEQIDAAAKADRRKPLEWLRLQIEDNILTPQRPARNGKRKAS